MRLRWEGPLWGPESLSVVGRGLCRALSGQGVEVRVPAAGWPAGATAPGAGWPAESARDDGPATDDDVTVRLAWPPDLSPVRRGRLVTWQPWEWGCVPAPWAQAACTVVDEVWAMSTWVRDAYVASGVPAGRVHVVRPGVDLEHFTPEGPGVDIAARSFRFLFVGGTILRKGIDVLFEAWLRAFDDDDDVTLVVKGSGSRSFYAGSSVAEVVARIADTPGAPHVTLIEDDLDAGALAALYRSCHALVHPYRAEGFGLTVAEAMACGLPVVTTAGGPTDEFVPPGAGWRLAATPTPIDPGALGLGTLAGPAWWLEPDTDALACLLRHVAAHPGEAAARGATGRAAAAGHLGWGHAAATAAERLGVLARAGATPGRLVPAARRAAHPSSPDAPAAAMALLVPLGDDPDAVIATLGGFEGDDLDGHPFRCVLDLQGATGATTALAGFLGDEVATAGTPGGPFDAAGVLAATGDATHVVLAPGPVATAPGWLAVLLAGCGPGVVARAEGTSVRVARTADLAAAGTDHPSAGAWFDAAGTPDTIPDPHLGPSEAHAGAADAAPAPAPAAAVAYARPRPQPLRVRLVGQLHNTVGVGENARLVAAALDAAGIDATPVSVDDPDVAGVAAAEVAATPPGATVVNLLCANSSFLPTVAGMLGDAFFEQARNIGIWHWELDVFPRSAWAGLALVDEVWMGSTFAAGGVRRVATVPVHTVPLPIPVPEVAVETAAMKEALGVPGRTLVLTMFDYLSVAARKNPEAVVRAFTDVFARPRPDGPVLVVKTTRRDVDPAADAALRAMAAGRPDIVFLDGLLSARERTALVAAADIMVSLHRAEGYGLTLAEAMAVGTATVATRWSGNLDFMTDANSFLVDARLVPVPAGLPVYPAGAPWAEADRRCAASALRTAYGNRIERERRVANARQDVATVHTVERTARWVTERLAPALARSA